MKVGILTFHFAHNYGAMLQAYALKTMVSRLGHGVSFLHYFPDHAEAINRRNRPVRSLKQSAAKMAEALLAPHFRRRFANFEAFAQEHLPVTDRYRTLREIEASPPDFDAIICGSDQVWNMEAGGQPVYFLQFPVGRTRTIAYAPSFGQGHIPPQFQQRLKEWLPAFDVLSVREASGVRIIRETIGLEAPQVLDPVFFLNGDDWRSVSKQPPVERDYILFYSLEVTSGVSRLLTRIHRLLKLPIVVLGKGGGFILTCQTRLAIDSGPSEFLGWFSGASFVLTNSFHATAFSLILGKPFYAVPHTTRNTRLESLLSLVGLESRLVSGPNHVTLSKADEVMDVDFGRMQEKLLPEVKRSTGYLRDALARIPHTEKEK